MSRQRRRLHPRRRADRDVAPPCRGARSQPKARFEAAPGDGKLRRFKEFYDGAQSWSRVERIIARVEVGEEGTDTRFIVTNLQKRNARALYQDLYCGRGQAENHIKSWKTHLAADRTSCTKATANQFRLFLHAGAYWLMWGLRVSMPKRSTWRVTQFDTLRLRLIKIAARVVEMKTMIRVHLPTSCPAQDILRFALATHTAPRHLSDGARGPRTTQSLLINPQTPSNQNSGPKPERNRCVHDQNHPNIPKDVPEPSECCIMPARLRIRCARQRWRAERGRHSSIARMIPGAPSETTSSGSLSPRPRRS